MNWIEASREEELPAKFTDDERRAYVWLFDCRIHSWIVDLLTKRVVTTDREWPNLVEFAKHHCMS